MNAPTTHTEAPVHVPTATSFAHGSAHLSTNARGSAHLSTNGSMHLQQRSTPTAPTDAPTAPTALTSVPTAACTYSSTRPRQGNQLRVSTPTALTDARPRQRCTDRWSGTCVCAHRNRLRARQRPPQYQRARQHAPTAARGSAHRLLVCCWSALSDAARPCAVLVCACAIACLLILTSDIRRPLWAKPRSCLERRAELEQQLLQSTRYCAPSHL